MYDVYIETTHTTPKKVRLTIRGRQADKWRQCLVHAFEVVLELPLSNLADPPLKLDVPAAVGFFLITEGRQGLRAKNIRVAWYALDKKTMLGFRRVRAR